MTIKRRIFLSNILMIVLTMAIGGVIFLAVRLVVVGEDTQTRGGPGGRFVDFTHIPIAPVSNAHEAFARGYFAYATHVPMYRSDLGDFVIVLPESYYADIEGFLHTPDFIVPTVALYLVVVLLLGNVLIAKYITQRIMTPINTLAHGVQEIAQGNLTHRIHYTAGDEFEAVCADFNDMAAHLFDMVAQRQADENSRKELIAGISHDLRTPLTSVKAYIEGLRTGVAKTPAMQEKYLNIIQHKTEDIEYIIKQLFLFSQIDMGDFPLTIERVDIGAEMRNLTDAFASDYSERGLSVRLVQNVQNAYAHIDRVQFKNMVQNILDNCVKYCRVPDANARITCEQTGNHVTITITDNGAGVPTDMLPKLFDVFYRGDEARNNPGKGSGLGLAICAKMMARLDGHISAENAQGRGLSIILTLPRAHEPSPTTATPLQTREA